MSHSSRQQGRAEQLSLFDTTPDGSEPAGSTSGKDSCVKPAAHSDDLRQLAATLPPRLYLGTSSWSFPGWTGLVFAPREANRRGRGAHTTAGQGGVVEESTQRLARAGLPAYAAHPLLRTVSLDRSFYAPLTTEAYAAYAEQVPADFRFVVKAPQAVTDAVLRRSGTGEPARANPHFLDATTAITTFITPAVTGLGIKAGPLVFQFPPLGQQLLADRPRLIARIAAFLTALPRGPCYAVEVRDASLVCEAFGQAIQEVGGVPCLAVHARMPPVAAQADMFRLTQPDCSLPLVARWNLHAGHTYQQAKQTYAPFDRLVEEDLPTRHALATLATLAASRSREVFITINNKAEGSAPCSVEALAREVCSPDRQPGITPAAGTQVAELNSSELSPSQSSRPA